MSNIVTEHVSVVQRNSLKTLIDFRLIAISYDVWYGYIGPRTYFVRYQFQF